MKNCIIHPLKLRTNIQYTIQTVLRDLASQEGCDGDPYDQMIEAADYIDELEPYVGIFNADPGGIIFTGIEYQSPPFKSTASHVWMMPAVLMSTCLFVFVIAMIFGIDWGVVFKCFKSGRL